MENQEPQKMEFFNSTEELQNAINNDLGGEQTSEPQAQEPTPEQPQEQTPIEQVAEPQVDDSEPTQPVQEEQAEQPQYTEEDVERSVVQYLSDRLGIEVNSLDDLIDDGEDDGIYQMDERIEAIAKFVSETGRAPEDWFAYQQMDPSKMDDVTALRVDMAQQYPQLNVDELNTLLTSRYKLDPDKFSEEEVKISQIQLKADAAAARNKITQIRDGYAAPAPTEAQEPESFITDDWISAMQTEVEAITGLEFDLGNGQNFTYGISDQYKGELIDKNARLEEFFDPYVDQRGNWDYDMLSSHRAVIDNIDDIVASVYKQGLADGQKGVVQNAANVQTKAPEQGNQTDANPLTEQLRSIIGDGSKMTFNI